MPMKRILLAQLPPPRFCFEEPPVNIPLAGGFLISALDAVGSGNVDPLVVERDIVDVFADEGMRRKILDLRPDILCLTLYVWNVKRSLFLASGLKRNLPGLKVLIGGPEVTPDNTWVMNHPAVDAGVFGEGESRIRGMLDALVEPGGLRRPPGVFFKEKAGLNVNREDQGPWDLGSCAYPYLDGRITPSVDGTLFLETTRGCPFKCRYCYYHKAFSGIRTHPDAAIEATLQWAYSTDSGVREIYLMDPTFNARQGFRDLLGLMKKLRGSKDISIHTELRADLLTVEDVRLLVEAGLKSAEVGLQSVNPKALELAGRKGKPDLVARGVDYLKRAGVEVTTGIIVGLPGDTPEWFSKTLRWLIETDAYSVTHPFVLSALPGTDFRADSTKLGLEYDPRPPYYVKSTPTFPAEAFREALLECEEVFDMEMDHIPTPSLVESGPSVTSSIDRARYVSKWIVDPARAVRDRLPDLVFAKASDPFTVWFRGDSWKLSESAMLRLLDEFSARNPHAILHVVLEFPKIPPIAFLERAAGICADPSHYVNRTYEPLYGGEQQVSTQFTVITREPGDPGLRQDIEIRVSSAATVVWDVGENVDIDIDLTGPVLVSRVAPVRSAERSALIESLAPRFADDPDEVRFRDHQLQSEWNKRMRGIRPESRLAEAILKT